MGDMSDFQIDSMDYIDEDPQDPEEKCKHEWKVPIDSMCDTEVICIFCGMPGDLEKSGNVYYPAT